MRIYLFKYTIFKINLDSDLSFFLGGLAVVIVKTSFHLTIK